MDKKFAKDQPEGFSNRIERVAIVGAGGRMGSHITDQLLKTGKHIVTAITRPSSTSQFDAKVKVSKVDYSGDNDTVLVEALRGQQVLIITMSVTAPRDTTAKLVRAAAKAGVAYVLPNWFGHDIANDKLCDESMLTQFRDSITAEIYSLGSISYFLLVSNFWYEFSLGGGPNRYGFDFKERTLVLFDDGNVVINTSTWPQCGRAIAQLLSLKELPDDEEDTSPTVSQFRNSAIYISSFQLSQRDMFKSVKRVTGTTDADWTITHESAEQRWKESQVSVKQGHWSVFTKMLYSRMFIPGSDIDYKSELHNGVLGLPVENLDESTAIAIRMGESGEVAYSH
ncbi:hypothetical protein PISL3812_00960 [Talaromyces islandicus]|uniref:NAD(P)-binding domain-containing protein n=1 Tax=Talaromyces islandicus TaxID=28573 RepID=A0A0U1LMF6_TALIS|nr:hypothetical protein PISL3812_00960 [Talaromyces islandicus]